MGARKFYERGLAEAVKAGSYADSRFAPALQNAHYNLACCLAQLSSGSKGKLAEPQPVPPEEKASLQATAIESLRKALDLGWKDIEHIRRDTDLDPIRELSEFKALLEEWEKKIAGEKK